VTGGVLIVEVAGVISCRLVPILVFAHAATLPGRPTLFGVVVGSRDQRPTR
jgi:hypothetical protein